MEIWETIRQNIIEIMIGIGAIGTYLSTRPKENKLSKLQRKRDKAHNKSKKEEKKLKAAYEKEAKLNKEVREYDSDKA